MAAFTNQGSGKQNINVFMLNSGIYIVKVTNENGGIETRKIIKK